MRGELPDEPVREPARDRPVQTRSPRPAPKARQRKHRFRPIGMLLIGIGLILYYADSEMIHLGTPLQVAAGVAAGLGVLLFLI